MMNKILIVILLFAVSISGSGCQVQQASEQESKGYYILSKMDKVLYMTEDYKVESTIDVNVGWDLANVGGGKVYATVRGMDRKLENKVIAIKNGTISSVIYLSYNMPTTIRYNKYDEYAYVAHTYKGTNSDENCISIINTRNDEEIFSIMYDGYIKDIVFSRDNKMFVSSYYTSNKQNRVDVFDLDTYEIIKSIRTDEWMSSMWINPGTDTIYAVSETADNSLVYVIDWIRDDIKTINLEYGHPSKIVGKSKSDERNIYITHVNDDNMEGNEISVIDYSKNEVVRTITGVNCSGGMAFMDDSIIAADWLNDQIQIITDDELKEIIGINKPVKIISMES